jgi:hypothetical protein
MQTEITGAIDFKGEHIKMSKNQMKRNLYGTNKEEDTE